MSKGEIEMNEDLKGEKWKGTQIIYLWKGWKDKYEDTTRCKRFEGIFLFQMCFSGQTVNSPVIRDTTALVKNSELEKLSKSKCMCIGYLVSGTSCGAWQAGSCE